MHISNYLYPSIFPPIQVTLWSTFAAQANKSSMQVVQQKWRLRVVRMDTVRGLRWRCWDFAPREHTDTLVIVSCVRHCEIPNVARSWPRSYNFGYLMPFSPVSVSIQVAKIAPSSSRYLSERMLMRAHSPSVGKSLTYCHCVPLWEWSSLPPGYSEQWFTICCSLVSTPLADCMNLDVESFVVLPWDHPYVIFS